MPLLSIRELLNNIKNLTPAGSSAERSGIVNGRVLILLLSAEFPLDI
jgi:hypothetical protein